MKINKIRRLIPVVLAPSSESSVSSGVSMCLGKENQAFLNPYYMKNTSTHYNHKEVHESG